MSALTSLLVRDEVVSVRQIEDALARQVLEGGELDTALLELDAAPENVLNAYRAASFRMPAVSREEVMSTSATTLALISPEQAERYRIIPIAHDANAVVVASFQPLLEVSRNELGRSIGMQVECCIACEVRIDAALARFYRRPMSARMERLAERVAQLDPGELPTVHTMHETPISGLAAELFDDRDDVEEIPAGAEPLEYESLRPGAVERVSLGHVVEVQPYGQPPPEQPPLHEAFLPPRKSSAPPRGDTQRGFGSSSFPGPPSPAQPPPSAAKPPPVAPAAPTPAATPPMPSAQGRVANDVVRTGVAKGGGMIRAKRVAVPQGPLTRDLASQLLERADDRDAVVEVFFRYARQYFDATALCSIREDRVLGREVHNVPTLSDIRGLSLSVSRGSALDEVLRTLQPRVEDLGRKSEDLPLADALRRTLCQPSALLPICIQRRVVAIIYGDRGGEYFRMQDLGPLVELLPEVSRAFERIIRTRKVLGLSTRARSLASAAAELGHAATQLDVLAAQPDSQDHAKAEALLRNARRALSALGAPRTAPPPPAAAPRVAPTRMNTAALDARALAGPVDARAATGTIDMRTVLETSQLRPAPLSRSEIEQLERIPTARMPAVDEPEDPTSALPAESAPRPAYLSKPPPGAGRYSSIREGEGDEPELEPESDTKRLRRQSSGRSSDRPRRSVPPHGTLDDADSLEAPRFESPLPDPRAMSPRPSKPPPGTGMYRQQGVMSDVVSMPPSGKRRSPLPAAGGTHRSQPPGPARPQPSAAKRRSQPPAAARRSQPPGAARRSEPAPPFSDPHGEPTQPTRRTSKRPAPGPAPELRDDLTPAAPKAKQVSAREADYGAKPQPNKPAEATVIVDTLGQARGLVDDLCSCGPDDEGPIVQRLLSVGTDAIDLLVSRFPGPLWFDRRKPYARLPFGRDAGPVMRALAAFGEPALSRLIPLLSSSTTDVRYYATLFVSDQVHPDLLVPLAERLFDEDPQIRLMVREALPAYKSQPGFAQVLGSLRTRMLETRAPLATRLAAIDAAAHLRDGASVPALVELVAHTDRQLSVPAHRALVTLTCQDFGSTTKKWRLWYEDNQHRHRVQWLIESLMHSEQNLRSAAGIELQKVTQVYYGYVASAPKRDRERAQKRYQEWWDGEGRKKL